MAYNAQKSKEEPTIPADLVLDAAIITVADGKVKDFVKNLAKWDDIEQTAINVAMEVMYNNKSYKFSELFTYREEQGTTVYSPRSKLGKYKAKYGKLPVARDQVKVMTNKEGFLRLNLD